MALENSYLTIAIVATGAGSNAKAIVNYFKKSKNIRVKLLLSNRSTSGIVQIGEDHDIIYSIFSRQQLEDKTYFLDLLNQHKIDFIVLAGFLWKVPDYLVKSFPNKILNIHPSLLPKYGGKGMYGIHVHSAVFNQKEKYSGLTIHLVNEHYDEGKILHQEKIDISTCSTAEEVARKVLAEEHNWYAKVIEQYIQSFN